MRNRRWAVFLSGRGSTAQAAFDLISQYDIRLAVSNNKKALGLVRARRMGIQIRYFDKSESYQNLNRDLKARGITHILLLGFMKLVPEDFCREWQGKIWNVHPSLLPRYPGLQAIEKSFYDDAPMGVTIHEVIPQMDAGHRLFQKKVKIQFEENLKNLAATQIVISATEQRLIRETIQLQERGLKWL